MIKNFKIYFNKHWPPINDDNIIARCDINKKISNIFTQYLERLLNSYCFENNLALMREIRFIDPKHKNSKSRKKIDYMICNKNIDSYFYQGGDPTLLHWHILIEAQWDNMKFKSDFVRNDFVKFVKFKENNKNQLKVAIARVNFIKNKPIKKYFKDCYLEMKKKMLQISPKDIFKYHYLVYLFALDSKNKIFHGAMFENYQNVNSFKYSNKPIKFNKSLK
jgi:hypothetical protein